MYMTQVNDFFSFIALTKLEENRPKANENGKNSIYSIICILVIRQTFKQLQQNLFRLNTARIFS